MGGISPAGERVTTARRDPILAASRRSPCPASGRRVHHAPEERMPDIGVFHPQIVHFVVALGIVGVVLRLVSLTGKLPWTRQAATVLLLVAAVSAVAAAKSGDQAHGMVERIP